MCRYFRLRRYLKHQNKDVGDINLEQLQKVTGIKFVGNTIPRSVKLKFSVCGYHVSLTEEKQIVYSKKKCKKEFCSK